MIICGTGHRPPKLGGYTVDVFERLVALAEAYLAEQHEVFLDNDDSSDRFSVISGMALGWDMALAQACRNGYYKWTAAIPFKGQEAKWPSISRAAYEFLLDDADVVHIVSEGGYAPWKMWTRNVWMVDHSDKVVALYNGEPRGGTAGCIHYAESQGKIVDNLWDKWVEMNNEETEHQMD